MGNMVGEVSAVSLREAYPGLARQLRLRWMWGRVWRGVRTVARAALMAAALVFTVLTSSRAYSHLVSGLQSLHRV